MTQIFTELANLRMAFVRFTDTFYNPALNLNRSSQCFDLLLT